MKNTVKGHGRNQGRRSYAPGIEALEALRLLSLQTALPLPGLAAEHGPVLDPTASPPTSAGHTWDAALDQSAVADLLRDRGAEAAAADHAPATDAAEATASGFAQLDRYLARTWARAGLAPQQFDDSTQAVYVTLLQALGRPAFDALVQDVGRHGIRDVLSRETAEGPDFFRAIDAVKKRAQRERSFQPLEVAADQVAAARGPSAADWGPALHEAIDRSLSPREADLIRATLRGESPKEIAAQWGLTPKTVSNEKARALQKLRASLTDPAD